jgi:transcriptional regulator with XRE-family HTH domain
MPSETSGLSQYVRRVMKLKGLTQNDVERMSGGRITDGYVASITTERATNLSVEKLVALADGLGVGADELFHVARGLPEDEETTTYSIDALKILETVQKAVASPEVTEILDEAVRMSPEQRRLLLESMKRVGAGKSKSRLKGKKPGNHAA